MRRDPVHVEPGQLPNRSPPHSAALCVVSFIALHLFTSFVYFASDICVLSLMMGLARNVLNKIVLYNNTCSLISIEKI